MAINPDAPRMPEVDVSLLNNGTFTPNSPGYPEIDISLLPGVPGQRGERGPAGPAGPAGADGATGPAPWYYQGVWEVDAVYAPSDAVHYDNPGNPNGIYIRQNTASIAGDSPIDDPANWVFLMLDNYAETMLPLSGGTMSGNIIMGSNKVTGLGTPTDNADAATKQYVDSSLSSLVDGAPTALNTLNELAAAINDDSSYAATITTALGTKLPLAGGTMTGAIAMGANKITSTYYAVNLDDVVNKAHLNDTVNGAVGYGIGVANAYTDTKIANEVLDRNVNIANAKNEAVGISEDYSDTLMAAEVTARNAAIDTALDTATAYTDSEIATEVTNRNSAIDTAVDTAISTEVTDRNSAIATALSTATTYTDTEVSAEASTRAQAVLDAIDTAEAYTDSAISTEVTNRNTAIAAEASLRITADETTLASANSYTDTEIGALTTTDIPEGTAVYFTPGRVNTAIAAGTGISKSYADSTVTLTNTGVVSLTGTTKEVQVSGSTGAVTIGLPDDILIANSLELSNNNLDVGTGSKALRTSDAYTNPMAVFSIDAPGDYAQLVVKNTGTGPNASTDIIAYADTGTDAAGYIDMGITSEEFVDIDFTITGAHDSYIFSVAPTGTTGDGNLVIATGDTGVLNNIVFAAGGLASNNTQMTIIPDTSVHIAIDTASTDATTGALTVDGGAGITGALSVAGIARLTNTVYVGTGAEAFATSAALTNPGIVSTVSGAPYAQLAVHNATANASTDIIAYADTGVDTSGWIDMGITGSGFTQTEFSITGAHDGYIFMEAPAGTTGDGNLVLATGANGVANNIVFAAGGYASGNTQMVIVPDDSVRISITGDSTSATTGALRVEGGVGISGAAYFGSTLKTEGVLYSGPGSRDFATSATLTNPMGVFSIVSPTTNSYAQVALHNEDGTSSADLIVYANNGDDASGWIDMGITGNQFDQQTFGITGPNDGYVFMEAPVGTTGAGNLVIATGANGTDNNIVFAAGGFDSGRTQMTIIPDTSVHIEIDTASTNATSGALTVAGGAGITGALSVAGLARLTNTVYVGSGAEAWATTAALTNPSFVANLSGGPFAQIAAHNSTANSSTDIIAYADNGTDSSGYIDMGITSSGFDQEGFGITGVHDGYIFMSAPTGTAGDGNLVLATSDNGVSNKIVFAAGGFTSGTTQMEIIPNESVHIEIATESTSPSTGALTVTGGAGILGNLNVQGDVAVQGTISFNGGGTTVTTENLTVVSPFVFVDSGNFDDTTDFGILGEYDVALPAPIAKTVTLKNLSNNVATLTTSTDHGFLVGMTVVVAISDATLDGTFHITDVPTTTTFSYASGNGTINNQAVTSGTATATHANRYAGLARHAADGSFNIFNGLSTLPTSSIDFSGVTYAPLNIGALTASAITLPTVTNTQFGYLSNVSSDIQTQLTAKANLSGGATFTGTIVLPSTTSIGSTTSTELSYLQGLTSAAQTQLDAKANLAGGATFTGTIVLPSTTSIGNVTSTEIGYLDGVTSSVQTQIGAKAPSADPTFTGTVVLPSTTSIGDVSATEIGYLDGVTSGIQSQISARLTTSDAASTYAPLASPTFTGTVTIPSGAAISGYAKLNNETFTGTTTINALSLSNALAYDHGGTGLTSYAKGDIIYASAANTLSKLTAGTSGYVLTVSATGVPSWEAAPVSLPTQTGNTGKYLTTDGTTASWASLGSSIPNMSGNTGKFLTNDGTDASWATLTASNLTGGTLSSTILGNSTVYIGSTAVALNRATGNLGLTGISSVAFPGSTSGTTTVQASATAGSTTFTLPSTTGTAALQGDTHYIGTTAVTLNRASANLGLTGISSVAFPGSTSGTVTLQAAATAGSNTITLPAATGTVDLQGNTFYVGTTQIANNRASGSQTLTGVNIDGNAATATTASSVTNGLTTSNYSSYAVPLGGGIMSGILTIAVGGDQIHLHPTTNGSSGKTTILRNDGSDFYVLLTDANTAPSSAGWNTLRPFAVNTTTGLLTSSNGQTLGGGTTVTGTLTISSDARLKENLTPINGAMEKVSALTGYNYNRIGSDKLEMGVVAQEVQAVAPELVEDGQDGMLSVAYPNMVALLIEAVKEQSAKIALLEEQVKELKG